MDKIWLKNYPKDVPSEIPSQEKTLNELFFETCREFAEQTAFVSFNTSLSFKELFKRSQELAAFLQNHSSLKEGDRIVIQLPNLLQFPISLWGSLHSGLVPVTMNPLYTPREMLHQIKDCGAKAIITLSNQGKTLENLVSQTDIKTVIVTEPGDSLSFLEKTLVNFVFRYIQKKRPPFKKLKPISFLKALALGQQSTPQTKERGLKDPLLYQYTSGTEGQPKAAVLTQENILSNIKQCELWMKPSLKRGKEQALNALPLFHIFSFMLNGLVLFLYGARSILAANPRDVKGLVKLLKKHPPTVTTGVNTLFKAMMENPKFKTLDFSPLKFSIGGGMALEKTIQEKWRRLTNSPLVEGYGLTEASPVVCCNDLKNPREGFAGLPFPSTEVRIVNEEGEELPVGKKGELEIRGPQIMQAYYRQPEETKKTLSPEGWLKTGDMAVINSEGLIKIVDRKKDMINVSGFSVSPNEVEEVIKSLPEVGDAAVIAIPHEKSGEIPKAFVMKKEETLTKEKILSHCKTNLSSYKVPKVIEFIDTIPKNLLGKPLRKRLRHS